MEEGFEEILEETKRQVWPVIEKYLEKLRAFPSFCQIPEKHKGEEEFHQRLVADYPERKGKYLRPTLTLLTASAMGFPREKALLTAAAMQTSEDWILNHDDIEDNSLERRGKSTLFRIYGKELALNAGDGLQVLMWKMLEDNVEELGVKKGLEIMEEFFWMLSRTILGQTVELRWVKEKRMDLEEEDILFILESKTGYYTIGGPMRLGAILGGAEEKQLEAIYRFGKILGRSFQIIDDVLDVTSNFRGLKKQTGNDIYEGKKTLLLVHLFNCLGRKEKERVIKILNKEREEKTEEEVEEVIFLMEKYGSIDYAKEKARQFAREAKVIFEKELGFLREERAREQIRMGIDFIVERDY